MLTTTFRSRLLCFGLVFLGCSNLVVAQSAGAGQSNNCDQRLKQAIAAQKALRDAQNKYIGDLDHRNRLIIEVAIDGNLLASMQAIVLMEQGYLAGLKGPSGTLTADEQQRATQAQQLLSAVTALEDRLRVIVATDRVALQNIDSPEALAALVENKIAAAEQAFAALDRCVAALSSGRGSPGNTTAGPGPTPPVINRGRSASLRQSGPPTDNLVALEAANPAKQFTIGENQVTYTPFPNDIAHYGQFVLSWTAVPEEMTDVTTGNGYAIKLTADAPKMPTGSTGTGLSIAVDSYIFGLTDEKGAPPAVVPHVHTSRDFKGESKTFYLRPTKINATPTSDAEYKITVSVDGGPAFIYHFRIEK